MFDNLLKLVRDNSRDAIIENPEVPNEQNDAAIEQTTKGIFDGLKSKLSGGKFQELMSAFSSGNVGSGSILTSLIPSVISRLVAKLGLNEGTASNIANQVIPRVMQQFVRKTKDPNDQSFTLEGILQSLGGGNAGGLLNKFKGLFG